MTIDHAAPMQSSALVRQIESLIGRALTADEARLAEELSADKTPPMIARELQGAAIADPKKIRPEHEDAADERRTPTASTPNGA